MNNFRTLYRYECKKLVQRKIVWVSFLVCVAAILLSIVAPLFVNYEGSPKEKYQMFLMEKEYDAALDGRKIDQTLLEETVEAYRKIPETPGQHYTLTEEYQQYARPYSAIFNFIHGTTDMSPANVMYTWKPSESDLYERRLSWLERAMKEYGLSEGEKNFWREREARIEKPFVYREKTVYDELILLLMTVGFSVVLLASVSLAGIFSDEHVRKTDQIILCCPLGKTKLYWAKMAAGVSFAAAGTILFSVITYVMLMSVYGTEGFDAAFQLIYMGNSDPITCGQAFLIAYGNMLITAVVVSVIVMALSELLRSNIATLAVSTGFLIVSMLVFVPEKYRVMAQIWDWLPWNFLEPWNVFGKYTLSLCGHYFTPWQAVPVIYLVGSVLIALIGRPVYKRYQVSGR